jgi:hypothetical protein
VSEKTAEVPTNSLGLFARMLTAVSVLLIGGSFFWQGIDFSIGVLLGSGIVSLNLWWTRRVVFKALRDDHPKARLWISFLFKFGLTVVILFIAILRLNIDPVGILVGISSLVITGFAFAFVRLGH